MSERCRAELDRIRDALAGADVGQDEGLAFEVATLQAAWEEMHREAKQTQEDARDAGEASMQAAFWRARAIELGADENEYRNAHGKQLPPRP